MAQSRNCARPVGGWFFFFFFLSVLLEIGGDRKTAAGLELSIERVQLCLGCIKIEAK